MIRRPGPHVLVLAILLLAATPAARAAEHTVQSVAFLSPSIDRLLTYKIALPAGYETDKEKRYPVLYLLHGLSSNYTAWARMGVARAAEGLDLIVVMPDAGNSWYANWATSEDGKKNNWEDYMVKDLIGHIDCTYRTVATREGRAINGLSMGGYGGLMLGLRHPDMFCSIGSHSGALQFARSGATRLRSGQTPPQRKNQPSDTPNPDIATEGFRSQAERTPKGKLFVKAEDADAIDPFKLVLSVPKEKLPHIYVDCGTEDGLLTPNREFVKILSDNKIPYVYGESPGGHNGPYWAREIHTSMAVQYAVLKRNLAKKPEEKPKSEEKPKAEEKPKEKAATP
jgi:putative tributyrin esterase